MTTPSYVSINEEGERALACDERLVQRTHQRGNDRYTLIADPRRTNEESGLTTETIIMKPGQKKSMEKDQRAKFRQYLERNAGIVMNRKDQKKENVEQKGYQINLLKKSRLSRRSEHRQQSLRHDPRSSEETLSTTNGKNIQIEKKSSPTAVNYPFNDDVVRSASLQTPKSRPSKRGDVNRVSSVRISSSVTSIKDEGKDGFEATRTSESACGSSVAHSGSGESRRKRTTRTSESACGSPVAHSGSGESRRKRNSSFLQLSVKVSPSCISPPHIPDLNSTSNLTQRVSNRRSNSFRSPNRGGLERTTSAPFGVSPIMSVGSRGNYIVETMRKKLENFASSHSASQAEEVIARMRMALDEVAAATRASENARQSGSRDLDQGNQWIRLVNDTEYALADTSSAVRGLQGETGEQLYHESTKGKSTRKRRSLHGDPLWASSFCVVNDPARADKGSQPHLRRQASRRSAGLEYECSKRTPTRRHNSPDNAAERLHPLQLKTEQRQRRKSRTSHATRNRGSFSIDSVEGNP
jgi:hypothetical protein